MYTYKAEVIRVVDGDTYDLKIDLGFNITVNERFRLRGADAPETWRPSTDAEEDHGRQATAAITKLAAAHPNGITVNTYKGDKYGRWLCDLNIGGTDVASFLIENDLIKRDKY